jgi:inner membrane transporter RhtA
VPASLFGVWMSVQPAVAALIGLALLGQHLPAAEWAGIGCVVAASAGAARAAVPDATAAVPDAAAASVADSAP